VSFFFQINCLRVILCFDHHELDSKVKEKTPQIPLMTLLVYSNRLSAPVHSTMSFAASLLLYTDTLGFHTSDFPHSNGANIPNPTV
jgi:hypothetical protein